MAEEWVRLVPYVGGIWQRALIAELRGRVHPDGRWAHGVEQAPSGVLGWGPCQHHLCPAPGAGPGPSKHTGSVPPVSGLLGFLEGWTFRCLQGPRGLGQGCGNGRNVVDLVPKQIGAVPALSPCRPTARPSCPPSREARGLHCYMQCFRCLSAGN